jgi:predicted  nucleic acid-binding Zn-ribbon protein
MPTTADNLRELHALHQRAKALRDRLASGPKTLAARTGVLGTRKASLEAAQKELKDGRAMAKNKEVQAQGVRQKTDELRTKLNSVKKQAEYDAIRNQIAHDNLTASKLEDDALEQMTKNDEKAAAIATLEAEVKTLETEVANLKTEIETKTVSQKTQLAEIEAAIIGAEEIIPVDQRDQYRRNVKQRASDAMAAVESEACSGCFVHVTAQMINELINGGHLVFCKTCGRILYLEEEHPALRRAGR